MNLDTMLAWQTVCQWVVIGGGVFTILGGGGLKYLDGKIMDEKLNQIENSVTQEIRGIPSRQQLLETSKELRKRRDAISRRRQTGH